MITVTPQGNIHLCNVPLENDYKNQLTFTNAESQQTYFNSKIVMSFDNYTYIKKDSVIKVGVNIDDIIGCNYLFYNNGGFTSKIYYCFISNKEYINENVTALTIETDVFQTYQFDISYKKCFIEREHTTTDDYGEHTVPEGLETGEYVYDYITNADLGTSHIVMASTIDVTTAGLTANRGGTYGGIVSGVGYYVMKDAAALNTTLNRLAGGDSSIFQGGKLDSVQSVFYLPDFVTGVSSNTNWGTYNCVAVPNTASSSIATGLAIPLNPTSIDGYTPHNRKLFSFPYCMYNMSNNQGGTVTYHLEDFLDDGTHTGGVNIIGACTPGGSIRAIPINYKITKHSLDYLIDPEVEDEMNDYGLTLGKFPIGSWSGDIYTNWLTTNGVSMAYNSAMSIINSPPAQTYTGELLGNQQVMNSVISVWQHSLIPQQAFGNINSGDVTFSESLTTFTGYMTTIKQEYAKIIDHYFDMYGYKVNALKTPNVTGRTYWNYVKTIGCELDGNIPQEHLNIIKNMFNRGVTFWHDPTKFMDYSQNNTVALSPST